jgi:hypothetical protein
MGMDRTGRVAPVVVKVENEMLRRDSAVFPIERTTDAEPNLPRTAQVQIGRRLRREFDGGLDGELPEAMVRALAALDARMSGRD